MSNAKPVLARISAFAPETRVMVPRHFDQLEQFARFVRASAHVLAIDPAQAIELAVNRPDNTAVAALAREIIRVGREHRPWLRWINKPQQEDECLVTIAGHSEMPSDCMFSSDGRQIISVTRSSTPVQVRTWALSGQELTARSIDASQALCVSGNGDVVVAWRGHVPMLLDLAAGREIKLPYAEAADVVAVERNRRRVAVAIDGTITIWDVDTAAATVTIECYDRVECLAWSRDGRHLACGSASTLVIYDTQSGDDVLTLDSLHQSTNEVSDAGVSCCEFCPHDKRLVSISNTDPVLKVWSIQTGKAQVSLAGHLDGVTACTWSPDGHYLASGSDDMTIRIWDTTSWRTVNVLRGHAGGVLSSAWSPDGRRVVSASEDGTLKVWRADVDHTRVATTQVDAINSCRWSPDGHRIASTSGNDIVAGRAGHNTVAIWDVHSGARLAEASVDRAVKACDWSPDGKRLITADTTVRLWDADLAASTVLLRAPARDSFRACCYSPDGSRVLASQHDTVHIWDAADGGEIEAITQKRRSCVQCLYCPDGRLIACADSAGYLMVWNTRSRQTVLGVFPDQFARGLLGCAWSPDGRRIVLPSRDGGLRIWDLRAGREVARLAHRELIVTCSYSADGTIIAGVSSHLSLHLWHPETGELFLTRTGAFSTVSFGPLRHLAIGEVTGFTRVVQLMNVPADPQRVTLAHTYRYDQSRHDERPTGLCRVCGSRFEAPPAVSEVIARIAADAGLAAEDSPCLQLPDLAWERVGLMSVCPVCSAPVRFNPFIA